VEAKAAVLFTNQAVFNPVQYCLGLTAALAAQPGCVVHENTRIILVDEKASPHKLTVEGEGGGSLLAKHVVLATHMPILDRSLHFTTFTPSRSCCIAVSLTDASKLPKAAWISDESTPMRSMRVGDRGELIVAGESFEQGSVTDTKANYDRLEEWARKHFPVERVTHRWSSMDYVSDENAQTACTLNLSVWATGGDATSDILRVLLLRAYSSLSFSVPSLLSFR
jgi:glycine/D-amino acid oxidase-like deaminating enzyme